MQLHQTILNRAATGLLAMPTPLANLLIGAPPIEADDRVLDRRVQLLLRLADLVGGRSRTFEPAVLRAEIRRFASIGMPQRRDVHTHDRAFDGPGSRLRARVYRPHGTVEPLPGIVYFHGGGWVVGDLDTHDGTCRLLAAEARCVVVAIDYRLAPEHPFPAPVDDAFAGYAWTLANAEALGIDALRVGVMGDSAGGNLAAVVALAAPDRGLPRPTAQGLVYPATNANFGTDSYHRFRDGFFLSAESMTYYRSCYLPDEADWNSPLASPLLAPDLDGLPPALVVTAGFDPLRDEGDAYAARLREAGVPVWHRCLDDQIHGAFGMGVLPGGMARNTEVCVAMGRVLRGELG